MAAGLLLAGCAHAPAAAPASGYYSSLRFIEEAGDYLGINLTLIGDPPREVEFENCEGWCNGSHRFPVTLDGENFAFEVREPSYGLDGKPAEPTSYRVVLTPKRTLMGRRLIATFPDSGPEGGREVLKPMRLLKAPADGEP